MTKHQTEKLRIQLQTMAKRIQDTAEAAEASACTATGGEAVGDLSSTPLHLGDVGSEVFVQELGATLLENERYLQGEIGAALERIENGTFGLCENCSKRIAHKRLEARPYSRFCFTCSESLHAGHAVNLNEGRPTSWADGIGLRADGPPPGAPGGPPAPTPESDPHAAGTPGGGSAVGGLAGTNVGTGEPDAADLEDAMGSGTVRLMPASAVRLLSMVGTSTELRGLPHFTELRQPHQVRTFRQGSLAVQTRSGTT